MGILIGIILLMGSVACVNLFKSTQLNNAVQYDAFFKLFTLLVDFIDYVFMRKQNLMKQTASVSSSKVFRKKVMVYKGTNIIPADKCGVCHARVFHLYRGFNRKVSFVGEFIKVSVRRTKPEN